MKNLLWRLLMVALFPVTVFVTLFDLLVVCTLLEEPHWTRKKVFLLDLEVIKEEWNKFREEKHE